MPVLLSSASPLDSTGDHLVFTQTFPAAKPDTPSTKSKLSNKPSEVKTNQPLTDDDLPEPPDDWFKFFRVIPQLKWIWDNLLLPEAVEQVAPKTVKEVLWAAHDALVSVLMLISINRS